MRTVKQLLLGTLIFAALGHVACAQKKTSKVEIETPNKKVEVEVEKTEKPD